MSDQARFGESEDAGDRSQRLKSMLDYAKQEMPHLMPGLPSMIRDPERWALGTLHEGESFLNFSLAAGDEVGSVANSLFHPIAQLMQPAETPDSEATWLAPSYHHRHGILPIRDAMMMGTHSQQQAFGDYMHIDLHPYYGQNLISTRGYWGADLAINLASPADTARTSKPWGKIVVGYTNGEDRLMDHGRGLDLHGEMRFNDHLTLNSGMRQSDTTGGSNYVLLQWKIATE